MIKKLSILVPAYNEQNTVYELLLRVVKTKFPIKREIIVVNDGSTDATKKQIYKAARKFPKLIRVFEHKSNLGKGEAVKTALKMAKGEYAVIQDADLEYDPHDIIRLINSLTSSNKVIYGSRLMLPPVLTGRKKTPFVLHYFGNRLLSLVTSILYGSWLTDMETCYKFFPVNSLKKIKLRSRGFEFEPEITAKLLKSGYKIKEIAISTQPRGYDEGKKIDTFKDGWRALYSLIFYRFRD